MSQCNLIYRLYDDQEEKHHVSTTLDHKKLEVIVDEYKKLHEKVIAREFIHYLKKYDPEAHEVEVKSFYF